LERRFHQHALAKGVQDDAVSLSASEQTVGPLADLIFVEDYTGATVDGGETNGEFSAHGEGPPRIPVAFDLDF
jgi:hypothetical protein